MDLLLKKLTTKAWLYGTITYDETTKNYYIEEQELHVAGRLVDFVGDIAHSIPVDFAPMKFDYTEGGGFVEDPDYIKPERVDTAFPRFKKEWETYKTALVNKLNSIEDKLDQIITHLGI